MPLSIYKRDNGPIWHYRGSVNGRRLRGSTGTADKKTAQRFIAELENKVWNRHFDGPGAGLTMAQVFNEYLDAGKSDRFLLKVAEYWKDTLVTDIYPETIKKAARALYPNASEPSWNRQVIKPTQAAINYVAGLGWCNRISVPKFSENPEVKIPADVDWVRAFNKQAIEDDLAHLGALCVFMFGTGARVGESCRMIWNDVDLNKAMATLYLFKPKPWTREAYLQPELIATLSNLPSNRNPDDRVFGYNGRDRLRGAWNNVCKRAGIERLTPHCCRHGFATTMLQAGYDVKTVAERGGWKDATTVLRTYAHAIKDRTVTDALFDTPVTHDEITNNLTNRNKRIK